MTIPNSAEYVDRVIRESMDADRRFRYDSDVAQAIGVSKSTISQYRGGGNMSVIVAVKLATLLNIHPMETISATMAHQTRGTDNEFWKECYETYKN